MSGQEPSYLKVLDQDFIIIDTTINVYKIKTGMAGSIYVKSILEKLMKSFNFIYACALSKEVCLHVCKLDWKSGWVEKFGLFVRS
jgi:hypothetical protein